MRRSYVTAAAAAVWLIGLMVIAAFAIFDDPQIKYDISDGKDFGEPPAETVYVTQSGTKFHRADCGTIADSKNLRKMKRHEAVELDYDPCILCKP